MPYQNGSFADPTNEDRADFAKAALDVYMERTGSDLDTAFRDLIGDLGHLWDRADPDLIEDKEVTEFSTEVEHGLATYLCEKYEEEHGEPTMAARYNVEIIYEKVATNG